MLKIFGLGKSSTFKSDRLENELIRAMEEEKLSFLGKKYAPSRYLIHCNGDELGRIRLLEEEFRTQYESFLKERIEKKKYLLAGAKIDLQLEVDAELNSGEYRVEAFLDKVPQEGEVEEKPDEQAKIKEPEEAPVGKGRTVIMDKGGGEEEAEVDGEAETEIAKPDKTKVIPRAKLTVISGSEEAEYRIAKDEVIAGRDGDVALSDSKGFVSSQHFKLTRRGAEYWITDLESTNGTEVNDQAITEQKLEDGDTIRVGEIELKFSPR